MKCKCNDYKCGWIGDDSELLKAVNPFEPDSIIYGCPECKAIDSNVGCCDEPGCNEGAGIGTPTKDGYRWTCYKHRPKDI